MKIGDRVRLVPTGAMLQNMRDLPCVIYARTDDASMYDWWVATEEKYPRRVPVREHEIEPFAPVEVVVV